ncbi:MAG TPA: alpha/beta fold hydrolase, partial [Pyrinomonadaceae bacterium]|nr:alpha/beta fold hydrolase [Pyrinomonadaceae bacterium]
MKFKTIFVLVFVFALIGVVRAQYPGEGYIRTADGVRLYYKIVGTGQDTILAVHGGPGNTMESILPDFAPLAKNHRVIYYDQRGNGRSDLIKDPTKLAIGHHVDDLEEVRSYFKLDKVTLLGNSWGGLLIGYYAAKYPNNVGRMILDSPAEPTKAFAIEAVEEIQSRIDNRYSAEQKKRYRVVSDHRNWIKAKDARPMCREFYQLLFPLYVSNE